MFYPIIVLILEFVMIFVLDKFTPQSPNNKMSQI